MDLVRVRQERLANGAVRNVYARQQDARRSKELSRITMAWNAPIGFKTKLRATTLTQGGRRASKVRSTLA